MYILMYDDYSREQSQDEIYSKPVKAGKRTYFFDVKATKGGNDYFLTITESKRRIEQDGRFSYDKHKIFLYKEDFEKFVEGLQETIDYVKENYLKNLPQREYTPSYRQEESRFEGETPATTENDVF